MKFTTITLRKLQLSGPDRFWKRRRILSQSGHYYGRRKNCYSLAVRAVLRSFKFETYRQSLQASYLTKLYSTRVEAGCQENGTSLSDLKKVLCEAGVGLGLESLQNLAIWEPRSFKGLTTLTKARIGELTKKTEGLYTSEPAPDGVITRGMIGLPISVRSATGDALIVSPLDFKCNSDKYLGNGPDYSFLDGRPTPLRPEEKEKIISEKENIKRAFRLKKELDFAKDRFKKMKLEEQEGMKKIAASKLNEKGDNILAEKFKKL